MSWRARESASRTSKRNSRSMAATADLPVAMPPVRPRRSIMTSPRAGDGLRGFALGFAATELGGIYRVAHEHGDGHGTDAAGDGSERAGGIDGVRMNVADEGTAFGAELFETVREIFEEALGFLGIGDAVGADVDDRGAGPSSRSRLDPIGFDVAGFAHGGDDDVGAAEDIGQIAGFGMANGDGGVGVHQQKRHGLADDVAPAQDYGVGAFDLDFITAQNFHTAGGSAGDQAGTSADEAAEIDGVEAVHVLGGIDGFEDALGIDLRGKRELNQDAINVVVAIQVFDYGEHFESSSSGRRGEESAGEANLLASGDFAFDVELRSGIFAHENGGKAGAHACRGKDSDFISQLGENLVADDFAVKDARGHTQLAFLAEAQAAKSMIARRGVLAWGRESGYNLGRIPPYTPVVFVRAANKGVAGYGTWKCVRRMEGRDSHGDTEAQNGGSKGVACF